MMDLDIITEQVKELICSVGDFIRKERAIFNSDKVETKASHDYVSYVDKQSEIMIVNRLKEILPEAGFITEEGFGNYNNEELLWIIDPLDGTSNFIHDNAPYCISIALKDKEDVVVGVVYECCRNELFWANSNSKAYMNGKEIHVSDVSVLDNSFIELGLPYNSDAYKSFVTGLINDLYGNVSGVRIIGAAACEMCYVAAGRADARVEGFLKPWDIAAASLIVRKAGGCVTDFSGNPICIDGKQVFASNGKIHTELLEVLNRNKKNIL